MFLDQKGSDSAPKEDNRAAQTVLNSSCNAESKISFDVGTSWMPYDEYARTGLYFPRWLKYILILISIALLFVLVFSSFDGNKKEILSFSKPRAKNFSSGARIVASREEKEATAKKATHQSTKQKRNDTVVDAGKRERGPRRLTSFWNANLQSEAWNKTNVIEPVNTKQLVNHPATHLSVKSPMSEVRENPIPLSISQQRSQQSANTEEPTIEKIRKDSKRIYLDHRIVVGDLTFEVRNVSEFGIELYVSNSESGRKIYYFPKVVIDGAVSQFEGTVLSPGQGSYGWIVVQKIREKKRLTLEFSSVGGEKSKETIKLDW